MRFIDKWVGIPLTFLFSIPLWFKDKILARPPKVPDTRRTLFIELSEMGSAILVDPAMRKLQREGQGELFFAIFKDNYKSLEILQTIPRDHIFIMRSDNLFNLAIDVVKFMGWCRRQRITCVIDLELFSRFTALLCGLSGVRSRIGFASFHDEGLYRGSIINFPVRYNAHVHISVNFVSLVNTALGQHDTPYPTHAIAPEEIQLEQAIIPAASREQVMEKVRRLFPAYQKERILLFNVNASDMLPQRRWLPENFAAVAQALLAQFEDVLILATGAPAERAYVDRVVESVDHPRFLNSAGAFEFQELIPLYSLSTFMLTNDSGPAHFASVTPLKVFVLFGPETPHLYGPLGNAEPFYLGLPCSPCVSAANHRKTTCITRPCITGIQPGWVLARLSSFLQEEGG